MKKLIARLICVEDELDCIAIFQIDKYLYRIEDYYLFPEYSAFEIVKFDFAMRRFMEFTQRADYPCLQCVPECAEATEWLKANDPRLQKPKEDELDESRKHDPSGYMGDGDSNTIDTKTGKITDKSEREPKLKPGDRVFNDKKNMVVTCNRFLSKCIHRAMELWVVTELCDCIELDPNKKVTVKRRHVFWDGRVNNWISDRTLPIWENPQIELQRVAVIQVQEADFLNGKIVGEIRSL